VGKKRAVRVGGETEIAEWVGEKSKEMKVLEKQRRGNQKRF
jgi:hypothetical protein